MATGPEHYREAEQLAVRAHHYTYGDGGDPVTGAALATEALVHATLALAAATALGREGEGRTQPSQDKAAWFAVAAECRKAAAS